MQLCRSDVLAGLGPSTGQGFAKVSERSAQCLTGLLDSSGGGCLHVGVSGQMR
jgi:hypothetical protein